MQKVTKGVKFMYTERVTELDNRKQNEKYKLK